MKPRRSGYVDVHSMSPRHRKLLWVGLILSVPIGGYATVSVVFYAWLSAASPDRWPPDRAGLWMAFSFFFAVLFFLIFVYCLVSLIRDANHRYREEQGQSAT